MLKSKESMNDLIENLPTHMNAYFKQLGLSTERWFPSNNTKTFVEQDKIRKLIHNNELDAVILTKFEDNIDYYSKYLVELGDYSIVVILSHHYGYYIKTNNSIDQIQKIYSADFPKKKILLVRNMEKFEQACYKGIINKLDYNNDKYIYQESLNDMYDMQQCKVRNHEKCLTEKEYNIERIQNLEQVSDEQNTLHAYFGDDDILKEEKNESVKYGVLVHGKSDILIDCGKQHKNIIKLRDTARQLKSTVVMVPCIYNQKQLSLESLQTGIFDEQKITYLIDSQKIKEYKINNIPDNNNKQIDYTNWKNHMDFDTVVNVLSKKESLDQLIELSSNTDVRKEQLINHVKKNFEIMSDEDLKRIDELPVELKESILKTTQEIEDIKQTQYSTPKTMRREMDEQKQQKTTHNNKIEYNMIEMEDFMETIGIHVNRHPIKQSATWAEQQYSLLMKLRSSVKNNKPTVIATAIDNPSKFIKKYKANNSAHPIIVKTSEGAIRRYNGDKKYEASDKYFILTSYTQKDMALIMHSILYRQTLEYPTKDLANDMTWTEFNTPGTNLNELKLQMTCSDKTTISELPAETFTQTYPDPVLEIEEQESINDKRDSGYQSITSDKIDGEKIDADATTSQITYKKQVTPEEPERSADYETKHETSKENIEELDQGISGSSDSHTDDISPENYMIDSKCNTTSLKTGVTVSEEINLVSDSIENIEKLDQGISGSSGSHTDDISPENYIIDSKCNTTSPKTGETDSEDIMEEQKPSLTNQDKIIPEHEDTIPLSKCNDLDQEKQLHEDDQENEILLSNKEYNNTNNANTIEQIDVQLDEAHQSFDQSMYTPNRDDVLQSPTDTSKSSVTDYSEGINMSYAIDEKYIAIDKIKNKETETNNIYNNNCINEEDLTYFTSDDGITDESQSVQSDECQNCIKAETWLNIAQTYCKILNNEITTTTNSPKTIEEESMSEVQNPKGKEVNDTTPIDGELKDMNYLYVACAIVVVLVLLWLVSPYVWATFKKTLSLVGLGPKLSYTDKVVSYLGSSQFYKMSASGYLWACVLYLSKAFFKL